jgi:methionyl-tRNA formyltransferase
MVVVFGSSAHHLGWTSNVLERLKSETRHLFIHVKNRKEMRLACESLEKNTLVIIVGWGWHMPDDIIERHNVLGLHPSDLPKYAGGTPIQHQIIDGITSTKMSLFELESIYDTGDIVYKHDMSIDGNMSEIFKNLEKASIEIILDLLEIYPKYEKTSQAIDKNHTILKRLQHEDGSMSKELYGKMSAREIYNFIRCREDPYPNTYYEDDTGVVLFKSVDFIPTGKVNND